MRPQANTEAEGAAGAGKSLSELAEDMERGKRPGGTGKDLSSATAVKEACATRGGRRCSIYLLY
jgi:hypothetical protein